MPIRSLLSPLRLMFGIVGFALVAAACQPTAPAPADVCDAGTNGEDPVIFVAGTFSPEFANELFFGNRLQAAGFTHCIFELKGDPAVGNIPGTAPIATSADSLAVFVQDVLAWSGASQVDLVGHSQGAVVARHYLKFDGGTPYVNDMVSLAGPHNGSDVANITALFADAVLNPFGVSCADVAPCAELQQNSAAIAALNAGDPTPGNVDYYGFISDFDAIVWNSTDGQETGFLGGGATNMAVQDECFLRFVGHAGMILDEAVYQMTADALTGQSIDVPLWACLTPTLPA